MVIILQSTFFSWLEDENYVIKSPVRRIHKIRTGKVVKEKYSDENLEIMRYNCKGIRNLAIIDLLNSTGMRVGELVKLNIDDIDFNERECIVEGKGDKQRRVYFDARAIDKGMPIDAGYFKSNNLMFWEKNQKIH